MRDNTRGLRQAAAAKRESAILKAQTALIQLQNEGSPINYNTVSKASGVSKAWLYIHLKQQIDSLRTTTQDNIHSGRRKSSVDNPKNAIIETLKKRIKDLEDENKKLRHNLEVAYGRLAVNE